MLLIFFFLNVFGDHLGLYFRYDIEYNTLGVMTMEMEMEQGDQRGGLISLNLWQCLRFPHSPVFSRIRRFVLLLYSLDRTLQCMRCGGRPARFSTVQESHLTGLEPGPPALYLAELTSLALHTVFPLRADRRVGSPA